MKTLYYQITLLFITFNTLSAQPGSLDTSFGTDGISITDITGSSSDFASSAILQPDGKILVTGSLATGNNGRIFLARYQSTGQPDSTFGVNGVASYDFSPSSERGEALALQPDGKILVAGYVTFGAVTSSALIRYKDNGTRDSSFANNGLAMADFNASYSYANAVAIQEDGKIVIGGKGFISFGADMILARFNTDGTPDLDFGNEGEVVASVGNEDEAHSIAIQPDGKILLGGFAVTPGSADYAVVRFNTDGSPDESFGTDGVVTTDVANINRSDIAYGMLLLPDGKILLAGDANYGFGVADIGLVQYNLDGSLDESFGNGGIAVYDLGETTSWGLARQENGKFYVSGQSDIVNGEQRWAVTRFKANGSLDTGFGDGGMVTTDFPGNFELAASVLLQPDEKIVLAGFSGNTNSDLKVTLARYHNGFNISSVTTQGISCYGESDGSIEVNASGGVLPYYYSIDGATQQSSNIFSGLPAGTYTVYVVDSNNGGDVDSLTGVIIPNLPPPPPVSVELTSSSITVNVDGTGSYQYSNDGGITFQLDNVFNDLAVGNYPIRVIDENSCTIFSENVSTINISAVNDPNTLAFEVSPNPGDGLFSIKTRQELTSDVSIVVSDISGKVMYKSILLNNSFDLRFLKNGSYQLRLDDGKNRWTKKLMIIH